jgi:hypothetical protein
MARLWFSRNEWPLIAAGVAAGVFTSLLLVYLFIAGLRGDGVVETDVIVGPGTGVEVGPAPRGPLPDAAGRGQIGMRERGIESRLDAVPVATRRLRGPLSITLRDVVLTEDDGARFARADVVRAQLDVTAAGRGDVVLNNVIIQRPIVALRQARPGADWNFAEVFAQLLEDSPAAARVPRRTVQLNNVQILGGRVDVAMPGQRFAFESVQARLPAVVFSRPDLSEPLVRVAQMTALLTQADPAVRLAVDLRDGTFQFPDGRVRFDLASVTLDETRFAAVRGSWDPADPGYGVTAEGLAPAVRFADVAAFLPEGFPATGEASFAWQVRPLPGDRTEVTLTQLDARSGESRATGSATFEVGEEHFALLAADLRLDPLALALVEGFTGPLPYTGTLVGTIRGTGGDIAFDLAARLAAPGAPAFTAGLDGRILLTADGLALRRLDIELTRAPLAALRALAPALPLDGFVTGRITLTGLPGQTPLALDVRLELGAGIALVDGTLDLTGAVPRYDLTGRLVGVDVQAVLAPDVPPVFLTANFGVRGSGFDPATMDATFRVDGRFTGWEAAPGDTLHLAAAIQRGVLRVDRLQAALATAALTAGGQWRFIEPQSGAVEYELAVASLRPFGPYLPVIGDTLAAGSIRAAGTLGGTLDRMRLAGHVTGTELRMGGWAAASLAGDYELMAGGGRLPVAVVDAVAVELVTPTLGRFTEATLALRLTPPLLTLALDAARGDGGVVEVVATGTLPEDGPREFLIERARFDLDEARWALIRPARIVWSGDDIFIDELVLEDALSDGRLVVSGRLRPPESVDMRVSLAAIPAGDVQRLLGRQARLEGLVWVEGEMRGTALDPLLDLRFRVEEAVLDDVPLQTLDGHVLYHDRRTSLAAVVVVDDAGRLDLRAELPSVLRLAPEPSFELVDGAPLTGSLTAEGFAIGPLLELFAVDVRDAAGVVDAQVTLSGTAEAPMVAGAASLSGGALTLPALNQRYDEITAEVEFADRRLLIRDARARSDGWVVASGQVVLERLDEPVLDLTVRFDGFRPVGVENQRDAAVFGAIGIAGAPLSLELSGDLRLDDGYVVIPQFGGGRAELIDMTRPPPVFGAPIEAIPDDGVWENLAIRNLRVTAGESAWFLAEEARVQLAGTVTVNKVGPALRVVGTLAGTRGQYTLIAGPIVRRFDIVAAQVRFLGESPPNPAVDITARRVVYDPGGRQLAVDVRITGTLQTPRLGVAGADQVGIAESELLSFLLFGQPSFALGGEFLPGEAILEQTFVGGFAELAAIELERGLAGLGFDIFQIRLGQGPLGGLGAPTLIMGRQLREDVFLTVETGITALFGGGATGESRLATYALRLDWAFDPRSQLRLAWEPVYAGRALRGAALALPLTPPRQQLLLELRRRWTY